MKKTAHPFLVRAPPRHANDVMVGLKIQLFDGSS
jgi:hypothetical protein